MPLLFHTLIPSILHHLPSSTSTKIRIVGFLVIHKKKFFFKAHSVPLLWIFNTICFDDNSKILIQPWLIQSLLLFLSYLFYELQGWFLFGQNVLIEIFSLILSSFLLQYFIQLKLLRTSDVGIGLAYVWQFILGEEIFIDISIMGSSLSY